MMQSAQYRHGHDAAARAAGDVSYASGGRLYCQPDKSAILVVIADVLVHQAFQMALVQNDYVVKQIAPTVADEALGDAVLPRTLEGSAHRFCAEDFHGPDDFIIEGGVAVVDQIFGRGVIGEGIAQLLGNPGAGWMAGDVEVQHAAPVMSNDEEAGEHAESQCRHGEKIHRRNRFTMIVEECHPPIRRFGIPRRFPHPAQHGSLRKIESQHLQFAVNARSAPSRILRDQSPLSSRLKPPQHHPEQFIGNSKSQLRVTAFQDGKLLTQRQVFQEQVAAGTDRSNERDEQQPQRTRHEPLGTEPQENQALMPLNCRRDTVRVLRTVVDFVSVKAQRSHKDQQRSAGRC